MSSDDNYFAKNNWIGACASLRPHRDSKMLEDCSFALFNTVVP
jgi:hypothetical protein